MTQLLEQALARASQLSEADQDALAAILLREIESERRWDELFSRPGSADILARMADEALAEADAGRCRQLFWFWIGSHADYDALLRQL